MFKNWQIRGLLGLTQQDVSSATGINMTRVSLEERGLTTYSASEQAAVTAFFQRMLQPYGYTPASERSLEVSAHA
jgi:transcriptional regulator with XRE-family HTH domain